MPGMMTLVMVLMMLISRPLKHVAEGVEEDGRLEVHAGVEVEVVEVQKVLLQETKVNLMSHRRLKSHYKVVS